MLDASGASPKRASWLDGFQRITSGGAIVPEIDGLRFIAITAVIFHHIVLYAYDGYAAVPGSTTYTRWAHTGAFGVQLFFAISGMVLGIPFARQHLLDGAPVKIGAYFRRRLTRLEPPYLLSLMVLYVVKVGNSLGLLWSQMPHLLASTLYIHDFAYNQDSTISGVAWSLEVEFQFYVLAPLLGLLYCIRGRSQRRGAIALLGVGMITLAAWDPGGFIDTFHLGRSFIVNGHYFLAGMLLADWFVSREQRPAALPRWMSDLMVPLCFLTYFASEGLWAFSFSSELFRAALVVVCYASVLNANVVRRFFRWPIIVTIGGMCYSLYLTHNSVIYACYRVFARISIPWIQWIGLSLIGPVAAVIVGAIFFRMIERPTMRRDWPQRLRARLFGASPSSRS